MENLNEWRKAMDYWVMRSALRKLAGYLIAVGSGALALGAAVALFAPSIRHYPAAVTMPLIAGFVLLTGGLIGRSWVTPACLLLEALFLVVCAVLLGAFIWLSPPWTGSTAFASIVGVGLAGTIHGVIRLLRLYPRLAYLRDALVPGEMVAEVDSAFGPLAWFAEPREGVVQFVHQGVTWGGVLRGEIGVFAAEDGRDSFTISAGDASVSVTKACKYELSHAVVRFGRRQMDVTIAAMPLQEFQRWCQGVEARG